MTDDYKEKVQHIKEVYEKRKAEASREKGLIIVFTGIGKGKSTAAFGMLLRAVYHGMNVGVIQFIKGAIATGESEVIQRLGQQVEWYRMGEGFHWITQDQDMDKRAARKAWEKSLELMNKPGLGMLILDEINVAIRLKQLTVSELLDALRHKPEMLHIVLTGRGAKPELLEMADLVTEMKMIRHPYRQGIKAQKGVEY